MKNQKLGCILLTPFISSVIFIIILYLYRRPIETIVIMIIFGVIASAIIGMFLLILGDFK